MNVGQVGGIKMLVERRGWGVIVDCECGRDDPKEEMWRVSELGKDEWNGGEHGRLIKRGKRE